MPAGSGRVWTRNFALAIVISFLLTAVFHMLLTVMALYTIERFQAADAVAGFAASAFVLGATLARVFSGKYLDVVGRKRFLAIGLIVFALASAAYLIEADITWLLTLRIIHGVAFGVASTALAASVMAALPASRRSEGAGYYGVASTSAMAIGPLVALSLSGRFGYEGIFLVGIGCSLATFVFTFFLTIKTPRSVRVEGIAKWRIRPRDVIDPLALPFLTVLFVVGISFSGILVFLNAHTEASGFAAASGTFFVVFAVTIVVARTFIGRVQDKLGDNVVMYPALGSLALGLVVLGLAQNTWVVGIAAVLAGFGFGAVHSGGQAIAVTLVPLERVGVATSGFFLALDFGGALGPLLSGFLVPVVGFSGMYVILAVIMVGSMVLYCFVHGRRLGGRQPYAVEH